MKKLDSKSSARPALRFWAAVHLLWAFVLPLEGMGQEGGDKQVATESLGVSNWFARGTLAEETGDISTALKHYQEAITQFDMDRKLAAEALLRIAANYQALGASESSRAAYLRVAREFTDLADIQARIPEEFKTNKAESAEQNILSAVEALVASAPITRPREKAIDAEVTLDPRQEERRVQLESSKQRVERSRTRKDEAHDQYQEVQIRLKIVENSPASSLPDSVRAGAKYEELKAGLYAEHYADPKQNEEAQRKAEKRINEWVREAFIPALQAELHGAELSLREWSEQYDLDLHYYQDILREIRYREMVDAENRKNEAREARKQIVVMGAIKSPGFYEISGEQLSIIEVIAMAGGFMETAQKTRIQVSRDGTTHKLSFDAELKLSAKDRFLLQKGDVLTVSPRMF